MSISSLSYLILLSLSSCSPAISGGCAEWCCGARQGTAVQGHICARSSRIRAEAYRIYVPGFDIRNVEIRGVFNKGIWHIECLCCELQVGIWLISQYLFYDISFLHKYVNFSFAVYYMYNHIYLYIYICIVYLYIFVDIHVSTYLYIYISAFCKEMHFAILRSVSFRSLSFKLSQES